MSFLGKLFGGGKKKAAAIEAPPCPHGVLVPHWGSVQDMGHEDRATSFFCDACHEEFTPEEARAVRASIAQRLIAQEATTEAAKAEAAAEAKQG